MMTFAQKLKNLMNELKLSQTQVSHMTGLSTSAVTNIVIGLFSWIVLGIVALIAYFRKKFRKDKK